MTRGAVVLLLSTACAAAPSPVLPGQSKNGAYGPSIDEETWSTLTSPAEDPGTTAIAGLALAASGELDRAREAARYCLSRADLTVGERAATALLLSQLYGEIDDPELGLRLREAVARLEADALPDGAWPVRPGDTTPNPAATALALLALRQAAGAGLRVRPVDSTRSDDGLLDAVLSRQRGPGTYGEAVRILIERRADSRMPLFLRSEPAGPSTDRILLAARRPTWRARRFAAFLARHDASVVFGDPPSPSREFDLVVVDGHDPSPWRAINVAVRELTDGDWPLLIGSRDAARAWVRVDAATVTLGAEVRIEAHGGSAARVHGPDGSVVDVPLAPSKEIAGRFTGSFLAVRVGPYRVVLNDMEESTAFQVVAPR